MEVAADLLSFPLCLSRYKVSFRASLQTQLIRLARQENMYQQAPQRYMSDVEFRLEIERRVSGSALKPPPIGTKRTGSAWSTGAGPALVRTTSWFCLDSVSFRDEQDPHCKSLEDCLGAVGLWVWVL